MAMGIVSAVFFSFFPNVEQISSGVLKDMNQNKNEEWELL